MTFIESLTKTHSLRIIDTERFLRESIVSLNGYFLENIDFENTVFDLILNVPEKTFRIDILRDQDKNNIFLYPQMRSKPVIWHRTETYSYSENDFENVKNYFQNSQEKYKNKISDETLFTKAFFEIIANPLLKGTEKHFKNSLLPKEEGIIFWRNHIDDLTPEEKEIFLKDIEKIKIIKKHLLDICAYYKFMIEISVTSNHRTDTFSIQCSNPLTQGTIALKHQTTGA